MTQARNHLIDRLRGFSILLVLCSHGMFPLFPGTPEVIQRAYGGGYYGVAIFFAISGFLITSNTLARYGELQKIDIREFAVMRLGRIGPPLLLCVAVLTIGGFLSGADRIQLFHALQSALTFQFHAYYLIGNTPAFAAWAPLWSLSIEELFYMFFPLVCLFSRRLSILITILLANVALSIIWRTEAARVYFWCGAADLLSIGCLAAITAHYVQRSITTNRILCAAGAIALGGLLLNFHPQINFQSTPTFVALSAGIFVVGSAGLSGHSSLLWRPLELIGRLSYELYLFHTFFREILVPPLQRLGLSVPNTVIVCLLVLIAFCWFISVAFSEPLNARIRRLYVSAPVDNRSHSVLKAAA